MEVIADNNNPLWISGTLKIDKLTIKNYLVMGDEYLSISDFEELYELTIF